VNHEKKHFVNSAGERENKSVSKKAIQQFRTDYDAVFGGIY